MERKYQPTCRYCRIGRMAYGEARVLQDAVARACRINALEDVLILLEHSPVYTLGRRGSENHLLASVEALGREGVEVVRADRGGDITFHGPGQLVGYPIISLKDRPGGAGRYLRDLEEVLILALKAVSIRSGRLERFTGVWVGGEKIAAIGVKIDGNRITRHGFALNVSTDLRFFDRIVPCGIRGKGVTSMERVLGRGVALEEMIEPVAHAFGEVFHREMIEASPGAIHQACRSEEAGG